MEMYNYTTTDTGILCTNHIDDQHTARVMMDIAELITLSNFDAVKSIIFYFYSMRLVIFGKWKCANTVDTGSDGNLIPIEMFKMLFSHTIMTDPNKSIDWNIIFCTYNNLCIPQIGIWRVTIINKSIKFQCIFSVMPGNGPALLGMPECERLQLLSINCSPRNDKQKERQINEQMRKVQDKQKFKR